MQIPQWDDYELIDTNHGEKLERWGNVITIRPDPQVIWPGNKENPQWKEYHMRYHRSVSGGGSWETKRETPEAWSISWSAKRSNDKLPPLKFHIRPTNFKHMGLFPEQASNWQWIVDKINNKPCKLLNLFAYTGGASIAAAMAGAHVTHVDAAKGMNKWAKENATLSGIPEGRLRFITDDVYKFVLREQRRGNTYDAIIMDPPSYGRGPKGELWKIETKLYELVCSCTRLLAAKPLFFLINSYTTGYSPQACENILHSAMGKQYKNGVLSSGELGLKPKLGLVLPSGIYARWCN
jgi:23S rRNA (cytosine1962-C5)-methyltransferase